MQHSLNHNETLLGSYEQATPASATLAARAREVMPSGLAHDSRHFSPHPIYVERASGPLKWDADGNRYIDYFGGHGALLLGHGHPAVREAVHAQLDRGTHFGACHVLEVRWGELIQSLYPSIQRLRYTSSGTEATLMAVRLARAYTGREKLVRLRGHFHGWHDHMTSGYTSHFDGTPTTGVLEDVASQVLLIDPNDMAQARAVFAEHGDVAAVALEPTGANFGRMPLDPAYITLLRELTTQHSALLIFDEVVTGFRVSPGGAQQVLGITPDLTTLAKILAGGLPGGAVGGRKDILDLLDFAASRARGQEKIGHPGTFNANPLSAAAGIATLEVVASGEANARANAAGAALRQGFNDAIEAAGLDWAAHGSYAGFHISVDAGVTGRPHDYDAMAAISRMLARPGGSEVMRKVRMGMLLHGVDITPGLSGYVSATHGEEEIEQTILAFSKTLGAIVSEGMS
jgi:glutamate-1-semialdehyde 2,1-aminomutase